MAGKNFRTDEDRYSAKPWNWKDWCLFVAFTAFAALTLYWGIHDYERVSYDHPLAQLGSMKSIMVGCVFAGISLLAVLLLCRQLLLGVPYLILDANGIVYRDVWGPCQRAKWSSLGPIELVVVGTKGSSNFAQAAVINSDVTATSVRDGIFKIRLSSLDAPAEEIAQAMNTWRSQAIGQSASSELSIGHEADPAEEAARKRMDRARERRRWGLWLGGVTLPLLFIGLALKPYTSLREQQGWALVSVFIGLVLAFVMTRRPTS